MRSLQPVDHTTDFCLEIHLTELCNYSCSYCNLHDMNSHTSIDYDKLFSVDLPKNTRVFIMGGEPTIDRHFISIIKELVKRGYKNIEVQTNLTFNVKKMLNLLEHEKLYVKFYGSFHMEYSKLDTFIEKCSQLKHAGMYGGVHLMWLHAESTKCLKYYHIMTKTLGNIYLEPTLPKSTHRKDWDNKTELKEFINLELMKYNQRLSPLINIDGTEMTIGEALVKNREREIQGMKCHIPTHGITFSVNRNRFYYCCFDLVLKREFNYEQFKKGWCVCQNKICCADIGYTKVNE
jgi:organic radical activating enzyme